MKEKINDIISYYGPNHQCKKLSEEVFELQEAIIKYEDYYYENYDDGIGKVEWGKWRELIAEEVADVMVLLFQFIEYYGIDDEEIADIMILKVNRQLGRISREVDYE